MDIDEVGTYLEHQGLSDDEIDAFLEHFGVKGQKWGVRKNRKKIPTKTERKANLYNTARKSQRTSRRVATGATAIFTYGLAKSIGMNSTERIALTAVGTAFVNGSLKIAGDKTLAEF